jgi:hypothetical protein
MPRGGRRPGAGRPPKNRADGAPDQSPDQTPEKTGEKTTPERDKAKPAKSDKATVALRVEAVLNMILLGAQFHNIRHHAAVSGWGVSDRQLRRYIEAADFALAQTLERDRKKLLDRHLSMRRDLFARCMQTADYSNARLILADEAALLDLYPVKRIAPTTPDGKDPWTPWAAALKDLSDDELAVLEKLAEHAPQTQAEAETTED